MRMQSDLEDIALSISARSMWDERLDRFGHTGWSDPVIYAYDQLERLSLIRRVISERAGIPGCALDFGCGTGDFCKLLLNLGYTVWGIDSHVKPDIASLRFRYGSNCDEIGSEIGMLDVILSVTVLDHILDDRQLAEVLERFRKLLKPDAALYLLEYALDSPEDRARLGLKNKYQAFRTCAEWSRILNRHSIQIMSVESVAHPVYSPSTGYRAYSISLPVRVLGRLCRIPRVGRVFRSVLERVAEFHHGDGVPSHRSAPGAMSHSPLKLMTCRLKRV